MWRIGWEENKSKRWRYLGDFRPLLIFARWRYTDSETELDITVHNLYKQAKVNTDRIILPDTFKTISISSTGKYFIFQKNMADRNQRYSIYSLKNQQLLPLHADTEIETVKWQRLDEAVAYATNGENGRSVLHIYDPSKNTVLKKIDSMIGSDKFFWSLSILNPLEKNRILCFSREDKKTGKVELMNYRLTENKLQNIDEGYVPIGSTWYDRIYCIGSGPGGSKHFCAFTPDGKTKIEIADFR
jgi:hypothetical protein